MKTPAHKSHKIAAVSKGKTLFFYTIAGVIPIAFFLLLEGGLRIFGYGKEVPLFIENPANKHYLLPRPDVMSRYFPDSAPQPNLTLESNFFLKQKPDNGLRIIVQGGSTAAGFPYGYGASLAATLDQRLKQTLVGKHVEVVGTALSAVNSYTLLDFADEIIEQQPDAVLIYAGHNEFLGILGVGSHFTVANAGYTTLWFLKLKNWRVFQLLQHLFYASQADTSARLEQSGQTPARPQTTGSRASSTRTFMSQVAKQKQIELDDEMFKAGVAQFTRNMQRLIDQYQQAGIAVFIGTIASNQRDHAPFSSSSPDQAEAAILSRLYSLELSDGEHQQDELKAKQTQGLQASVALQSSRSADLHYGLAKRLDELALFARAKTHYQLAIEHDRLRFRAPEAINKVIRDLANRQGIYLVDSLLAFEQRSPNHIVGNNLMLEHLHPNLQGYYVLSESFYQALKKSGLFAPWQDVPIALAWQQRLVLPAEEYFGFATIQRLMSDYPFSTEPMLVTLPQPADWQQQLGKQWFEKRTDWQSLMQQSLARYRDEKQFEMAFKTLQILADALPHNGLYNLQLAEEMLKKNRLSESLHYYQRAKLAGAVGGAIDHNIRLIEQSLAIGSRTK
jgi:lysophospholipase L1-like esterase